MKRSIRMIALVLALVTVFILPASADDFSNDSWMNVLDYCYPNDEKGTSVYSSGTSCDISFDLPGARSIYDVDMVVRVRPGTLSSVTTSGGSGLTVLDLGSHTYRIYGRYSNGGTVDKLNFTFVISSAGYIDFLSLDVSHLNNSHFNEVGYFELNTSTNSEWVTYSMPNASTSVTSSSFRLTTDYVRYGAYFACSDWAKYDYLDFYFSAQVNSIDSLNVMQGSVSVPFSASLYDMAGQVGFTELGEFEIHGDYVDLEETYEDVMTWDGQGAFDEITIDPLNIAYIVIRIDLRGLDRSGAIPKIHISGTGCMERTNYISLKSCSGYVEVTQLNPFITFFRVMRDSFSENIAVLGDVLSAKLNQLQTSVTDWLEIVNGNVVNISRNMVAWFQTINDTLTSGFANMVDRLDQLLHPDTTESEEMEATVESQSGAIEDANDALEEVTKPDVEDVGTTIDAIVNQGDTSAVGDVLAVVLENELFSTIIFMSLGFAIIGYVFYGKR